MNLKLKRILSFFLNLLNHLFKKKNNRILLFSNLGFRDNVLAVYSYLVNNEYDKKYEIIIASDKFYSEMNKNVKQVNLFVGMFYYLTSKYIFYCFGTVPIYPHNQKIINLWHGMPLKKIGKLKDYNRTFDYFSYVICYSDFFESTMKESFGVNSDRLVISGSPRNDELFSNESLLNTVIWMPTYRDDSKKVLFYEDNSFLLNLDKILLHKNIKLTIKPHPLDTKFHEIFKKTTFKNINIVDDDYILTRWGSLYKMLAVTKALITDYSSVYIDYLLLLRPIAFTIEDKEDYLQSRGVNFSNLDELLPGPKLNDLESFSLFFDVVNNEINDDYKENRKQVRNKFYKYKDENSTKRILNMVGIIKGKSNGS